MKTFIAVLRKIVEDDGVEIFNEPYRFWAIAEDYVGEREQLEIDMLLRFVDTGLCTRLGQVYAVKEDSKRLSLSKEIEEAVKRTNTLSEWEIKQLLAALFAAFYWDDGGRYTLETPEERREREERERKQLDTIRGKRQAELLAERRYAWKTMRLTAEEWAQLEAEARARKEAEVRAKREAEERARKEAEERARREKEKRQKRNRRIAMLVALLGLCFIGKGLLTSPSPEMFSVGNIIIENTSSETVQNESDIGIQTDGEAVEPETVIQEEVSPEIPDLKGYSYQYAESKFEGLNAPIIFDYEFSKQYNRGCVVDAEWKDGNLLVTLSKGLEYTYYDMYKINSNGDLDYRDIYYVGESGQHTEAYKVDANGDEIYYFTFEYDEYNRETAQNFYDSNGMFHHYWKFEYNDRGQITVEHKFDSDDHETDRYEYEYDSEHRMSTRKEYKNGQLIYTWKMTQYDNSYPNATYSSHLFGCWTKADIYDANGSKVRYAVQEFDSHGSIKAFSIYNNDGTRAYEYLFDSSAYEEINNYSDSIR